MQIKLEQLPQHLQRGLSSLYVLHGEEAFLLLEAADRIRSRARQDGFIEREVLTVEPGFKWNELMMAGASQSLFGDRKLLELRIPSGKPGTEGAQVLQDYCANLSSDTVTLITLPKLDRAQQSSKWFTTLDSAGVVMAAWPIDRSHLPQWISARLALQNQQVERTTLEFLADKVEGNLFAAHQEVQKLALLYPEGALSLELVRDAVLDVTRYDVFKLGEALLQGDAGRFMKVLDGLHAEGESPVLVLWALTEEIRTMLKLKQGLAMRQSLSQLMKDHRVWGERQKLMEPALRRVAIPALQAGLRKSHEIDRSIKGVSANEPWAAMMRLGLSLCASTATRFDLSA
ncbi:DNA polymerase III subunit delta [Chitinivorax sp. B]|uniref:DNA polymerase III subunit delta n=1 Tax=Chitinivorax sp. B TaxID=2502235 RepID=UPI0010F85528|nr:DNA polymerase III subunit delta [Chitinivorax sp. B]